MNYAIFGMVNIKKINNYIIYALILFLPWHSLFISGYLVKYVSFINLWKDVAIFVLLSSSLFLIRNKLFKYQIQYLSLVVFIIFSYLFLVILNPSEATIYGLRYNVIALLAFAIGLIYPADIKELRRVVVLLGISAVLSLMFGVIQAYMLGPDLLLNAGYPSDEGSLRPLKYSFYIGNENIQRVSSGFSGPLAFSFYMFFVFAVFLSVLPRGLIVNSTILVAVTGLVLGFSRAFLVAALIFYIIQYSNILIKNIFSIFVVLLVFVTVFYIGLSLDVYYFEMVLNHILKTISLEDRSLIGHVDSYVENFAILKENWFLGIGLGSVGPQAAKYIDNPSIPESSFLALWLDGGLIVFLASSLLYLMIIIKNKYNFVSKFLLSLILVLILLPIQFYTEVTIQIALIIGMYIRFIKQLNLKTREYVN